MTMKTLTTTYLEKNHINTLRHDICEIVYKDYKGATFFLSHMVEEKKIVLTLLLDYIKKNPDIYQYKNDSSYWYPYENVEPGSSNMFYNDYYIDTKDNAVHFVKESPLNNTTTYDYLLDPVKIQFLLMSRDISKMDCQSPNAKEIISLNQEIFETLYDVVGDPLNYEGKNNLNYFEEYILNNQERRKEIKDDKNMEIQFKRHSLSHLDSFLDNLIHISGALTLCRKDKLEKKLNSNNKVNIKSKI